MEYDEIVSVICSIPNSESGGDNALDGFEFQVSSAIYLIFENLQAKKKFSLIYEKIEDFIIINDSINLFQAKSISDNLTPKILYKEKQNSVSGETCIIYKMYDKVLCVKAVISDQEITNTLIMSSDQTFSNKLFDNKVLCDSVIICFSALSDTAKKEIEDNVKHDDIDWAKLKARRLFPKISHEEMTRIFIEDVVSELFGSNKISSSSLYNSLCVEIKKIRKSKKALDNNYLTNEIRRFSSFDIELEFQNYCHLLNQQDQQSIHIIVKFNSLKMTIFLNNSPDSSLYNTIREYLGGHVFDTFYDYFSFIKKKYEINEPNLYFDEYKFKAILLIYFAKEVL